MKIRQIDSVLPRALTETQHGELAQNGDGRKHFYPAPAWLVAAADRTGAGPGPGDGGPAAASGGRVKTSHCAPRLGGAGARTKTSHFARRFAGPGRRFKTSHCAPRLPA